MKKTVFYGDSLTANFTQLNNHANVVNLGRSGDKTTDLISRFFSLMDEKPERIFLLIGTNDILVDKGYWQREIHIDFVTLYTGVLALIRDNIPHKSVYLVSIPPINIDGIDNEDWNYEIDVYNGFIERQADRFGYVFLDLNRHLKDDLGNLAKEYTLDGVHLNEAGYNKYYELVRDLLD